MDRAILRTRRLRRSSEGFAAVDGVDVTHDTPVQVARRGVVRSFQISAVFPHLSVLQNVRVALQRRLPA